MPSDPNLSAREKMVKGQLVPGNILDEALIRVFGLVPRELFVAESLKGSAYVDETIPVSRDRYLLPPLLLARMLDAASIKPTDAVLDLACASGYSTVVLSHLAARVVAVEEQMELAEKARSLINRLHRQNAEVITGPVIPGYPSAGPYDVIMINGSVETVPATLTDQLAEGGRLILVRHVTSAPRSVAGLGRLEIGFKQSGRMSWTVLRDASAPLLPAFEEKRDFVF